MTTGNIRPRILNPFLELALSYFCAYPTAIVSFYSRGVNALRNLRNTEKRVNMAAPVDVQ